MYKEKRLSFIYFFGVRRKNKFPKYLKTNEIQS